MFFEMQQGYSLSPENERKVAAAIVIGALVRDISHAPNERLAKRCDMIIQLKCQTCFPIPVFDYDRVVRDGRLIVGYLGDGNQCTTRDLTLVGLTKDIFVNASDVIVD